MQKTYLVSIQPRKVIDLVSDDVVLDVLKFLPGEDLNQAKNFSLRLNSLIKNNISQLARRMFYGRVDINEDGEIDAYSGWISRSEKLPEQNLDEFWNKNSAFKFIDVVSTKEALQTIQGKCSKNGLVYLTP